jgi:hypothetical protein
MNPWTAPTSSLSLGVGASAARQAVFAEKPRDTERLGGPRSNEAATESPAPRALDHMLFVVGSVAGIRAIRHAFMP